MTFPLPQSSTPPTSRGPTTLLSLPTELLLTIMASLPNYPSLLSLLQTCRLFAHLFSAAPSHILQAILSRLLHPRRVPEALNVRLQILCHDRRRNAPPHPRSLSNPPQLPPTRLPARAGILASPSPPLTGLPGLGLGTAGDIHYDNSYSNGTGNGNDNHNQHHHFPPPPPVSIVGPPARRWVVRAA